MRNSLVIGESETNEGYTVFRNLDEDMVREIKAFQMPVTVFSTHRHTNATIVQKLNDTQNLCIDEDGENFIETNDGIQRYLKENKLNEINKKFDIIQALEKTFGTIYNHYGYCKFKFMKNSSGRYNELGGMGYTEVGIELSTYGGISIKEKTGEWVSIMFCHLNEDGNIENRDYNINIEKQLDNKLKNKDDLIQEIIAQIPDVPYKNYGNKWFSNEFAFVLNKGVLDEERNEYTSFYLGKLQKASGDNYGDSRHGRTKMPASAVEVTRDHLLRQLLPIVNEVNFGERVDLSKYLIGDSKEEIKLESSVPQKRVQKTIINENEYDVYDFTEEENDFDDEEVIAALKNIEQSIDIPGNVAIVLDFLEEYLHNSDLPSFSFDKGEAQEDHSDYKGYVKMPYGCNFTFGVCEGDVCEITWAHSIYYTDIIELEFVD